MIPPQNKKRKLLINKKNDRIRIKLEKNMAEISYYTYKTLFGNVVIVSDGSCITYLKLLPLQKYNSLEAEKVCAADKAGFDYPLKAEFKPGKLTDLAAKQLGEYFTGARKSFDLPLAPRGTDFQKAVWKALQDIPYGETRSYKQIAETIKSPKACRAVGMANNKNPIWIIIPCHRVIGADGSLTGYGGGLDMKEKLLKLEKSGI